MDKEALSHYGWIVIVIIILAIFLAIATPLGTYIFGGFKNAQEPILNGTSSDNIFISGACTVDFTAEELASRSDIYQIGKTKPEYVLAIFNEDFTEAVIVNNGENSDGKIKDFSMTSSPFTERASMLTNVELRGDITEIGNFTFYKCAKLKNILIPNSVEKIGNFAITECNGITTIRLPKSLEIIRGNALPIRESLVKLNISDTNKNYTTINNVLFSKDKTQLIFVPNGLKYETFVIPEGVKTIGTYAFYNTKTLKSIIIPEGVEQIVHYAFGYCSNLNNIELPSTVKSLDTYAFAYCKALSSIKIPEGVSGIPANVFNGCTGLNSITLPSTINNIDSTAFSGCSSLTTIYGIEGSYVQTWATNNGYTFVAI